MDAVDTMMLITSADEVMGKQHETLGHVFGLTVRSRSFFINFGAGIRSLAGGEVKMITKNFENSRKEAIDRMIGMAKQKGGDAIVAFRFDTTTMGETFTEVCAYGTAVKFVNKV